MDRLSYRPATAEVAIEVTRNDPSSDLPTGIHPGDIDAHGRPERRALIVQAGGMLEVVRSLSETYRAGSPLADVRTRNGLVEIEPLDDFWESGTPPTWAEAWGWDEYGAWVEFSVEGKGGRVTQRMRWIPPGSFLMGSRENEPERDDSEGPQHEVIIREGFWLFDTACTQALWQAVMGENRSRFNGADRPVENVSWNGVQAFMAALNERKPGLDLCLPSEAQWEYACRAGTQTPFSFGENITPERVNYDGNVPYAGGPEGRYREETVPVKSLPANPWGLYEMHGNVWEWVQDAWHGGYDGAPADGSVWEAAETGAFRVIRGGSWFNFARRCRSACRYWFVPDHRNFGLGFRCTRVQGREPGRSGQSGLAARSGGEPLAVGRVSRYSGVTRRSGEMAEQGLAEKTPNLLRLDSSISSAVPLPQAPAFRILTDRERLTFRRMTKPEWARAMGRDRFGLWAEIAIEPSRGEPVVQRLRWIPPGRFVMGSQPDEPGRWDEEGPQHPVTIAHGFWLFDTPCTQALWEAVLGENPSRFRDPERPVESVSWEDIQQRFLPAFNERMPGFALPSEAQWEYACRAGTETALYTGPIEILSRNNAPALDPIAWYGGNSGVDFELDEAYETTGAGWEEMQYPTQRAGTRKVKGKQANPWGLYDMLGNVWEWVEDPWHESYEGAPSDGGVWEAAETGAGRVIRGGSWLSLAGVCRSAYRSRRGPDSRVVFLGFRCARVQP